MNQDLAQLLGHGLLTVVIIVVWFALASLSRSLVAELLLGNVGLLVAFFYWGWMLRHKAKS